jgi:hypothetical protein
MSELHAQPSDDLAAADWVITRQSPDSGEVDMLLPPGFAAYARLLHPLITEAGDRRRLIRWREIAPDLVPFDRRVQFPAVAAHSGIRLPNTPFQGSMPEEDLDILLGVLAGHTATRQLCWFCVWYGYGSPDWQESEPADGALFTEAAPGRLPDLSAMPDRVREQTASETAPRVYPLIEGPLRDYWLFSGPLGAAGALPYPPSLWWPDDHAWCVASDIDLDSTYIGGSRDLIDSLLACPDLEVLPADLHDLVVVTRDDDEPGS